MSFFKLLFSFYLTCLIALTLVVPHGYSIVFFLISLTGLILWLSSRDKLVDSSNRWLIWPSLFYALGEGAIGLIHNWSWRTLDPYVPFILLIFGVWALRKHKPDAIYLWCGLGLGAIGASVISGYQSIALGQRAEGFTHAIQFGNAALLMGMLCLVRLLTVRGQRWIDALMAAGFVSGLAASVWSQTRGGWLALFLIFVWMVTTATYGWPIAKRLGATVALLSVLSIPALQTNGIVQKRVMTAVYEVEDYFVTKKQDNSIGFRLSMWEFASKDILQAPLLGHGAEGWMHSREAGVAAGALHPLVNNFSHLHNEYLDVAYKNGLLGLFLLVNLYLLPIIMFFKPHLHRFDSDVKALAMGGVVLSMMYVDFGLTQTFLSHNSGRMVFANLLMCFGALLLNEIEVHS